MPEKTYKILIIDDDKGVLDALENAFAMTDYQTRKCDNPLTGYKMIEDEHFDIVICDIMMKEMDGLTLLRKIKDFNGMIQVIIITGNITINNTIKAFRYGASDIHFKPFEDITDIIKAVDRIALHLNRVNAIIATVAKGKYLHA